MSSLESDVRDAGDGDRDGETSDAGSTAPVAGLLERIDTAAFGLIGHGICVTDTLLDEPGPRVLYVNQAYLDIFSCERDEVVGHSPRFAQGPLTDPATLARIREHLVSARSIRAQAVNYRIDRTPFRLRWTIDPIRLGDELAGFVAVMNDVTIDDRVRRRLSALDMLMTHGRAAVESPAAARVGAIGRALADSFEPLLEEVGEATVESFDAMVVTPTRCAAPERAILDSFVVADRLRVTLRIHPDGEPLVDRVAIDEMCHHARWLLDLARWA
ncbi:MAG: PAS domain-containing protein [Ilumatobacter sp.]